MTHNISIYGDIVPFACFNDGSEYDLKALNNALSSIDVTESDEVIVGIHTFGGDTATAFAIYNALQRFKNQNKINLTTRVDGWCASSGVIILLAGDKRIGNAYAEPFVHNAWTVTLGDKKDLVKTFEELSKVDDMIASLYAERTAIEKDKAIELMNSESFVSVEDCLAYGFYTELENVYAAENTLIFNSLQTKNTERRKNKINNKMTKSKKSAWQEFKNQVNEFLGIATTNKIVFTAENSELDFYELEDNATPVVGDKATFDGKPAGDSNDGTYLLASGETYVFEGEELKEIKPKAEDNTAVETLNNEIQSLKKLIEEKEQSISEINNKLLKATEIINTYKTLESGIFKEDKTRDPKVDPKVEEIPIRNYFKNIK